MLLLGTLPWSVQWFRRENGIQRFRSGSAWKRLPSSPPELLLACWICVPMLILSLASSKLGLYALPVFPALALATSRLSAGLPGAQEAAPSKEMLKQGTFVLTWAVLLLISRMILGAIPSGNDCKALWQEIKPYLPKGDYEVVTVDERADGLLFYGAMEVENTTRTDRPYPTFMPPETVEKEVQNMVQDHYPHLFLINGYKHVPEIQSILSGADWQVEEFKLRHNFWLLRCKPSAAADSPVRPSAQNNS